MDAAIGRLGVAAPIGTVATDESRFDRASWMVLGLAILFAAVGVVHMVYVLSLPSDGWSMTTPANAGPTPLQFDRDLAGTPSPLKPGDALVAIEGQTTDDILRGWLTGRPKSPAGWGVGQSVAYTVDRDGRRLTLSVPLGRRSASIALRQLRDAPVEFALLVVFAAIGVFVFLKVPRNPAARALLLLGADEIVGLGVYPNVVGVATPSEMFDPVAGPLRLWLYLLFFAIYLAFWMNLFVVFPTIKGPMRHQPALTTGAIYAGPLALELVAVAVSVGRPSSFYTNSLVALAVGIIVTLLVAVAGIVYSFRTLRDPVQRAQLRWLVFAVVLSNVVPNLLGVVNVGVFANNPILATVEATLSVSFPIAMGVAILRYRLFDIDVIINRTLVYGTVTAALGVAYFGGVALFQQAFRTITGQTSDWAVATATVATIGLFAPVRGRAQEQVDRRFYRRKYNAAQTVAAFSATARDVVDLAELAERLRSAVQETVQPSQIWLWLQDAPIDMNRLAGGIVPLSLAPSNATAAYLIQAPIATPLRRPVLDSPTLASLRAIGVDLVVPLVGQGDLLGLLCLGPRRSGQQYSVDDRLLLNTLASQAAPAIRVARLVQEHQTELQARARIEEELRLAQDIQLSMLPNKLPTLPNWSIAARYQPAHAVGGDFYDFLDLPDGRLALVLGDVSGKGMPAALLMAMTRTIIHSVVPRLASPGQVMARMNDQLCRDMPRHMFVTCFFGVLDPINGRLIFANAGHSAPFHLTPDGVADLEARGMPLGLMADATYAENEVHITSGDALLLYSDGMTEARDATGHIFGVPRLRAPLADRRAAPGKDVLHGLLGQLAAFSGAEREQDDDVTLVWLAHTQAE
jgi:serine phosphatase RsbU (regulator of sigma subunit)